MDNPFSWDYLTAPIEETPTFGPFSTAFFVLMAATLLFAIFLYFFVPRRLKNNPVLARALHIGSQWMMWLCGVALFFFAFRMARIDVFTLHLRLWSYLFFAAYIGSVGYFIYWFRAVYPAKIAALNKREEFRRYSPHTTVPRQLGARSRRRSKQRRGAR